MRQKQCAQRDIGHIPDTQRDEGKYMLALVHVTYVPDPCSRKDRSTGWSKKKKKKTYIQETL